MGLPKNENFCYLGFDKIFFSGKFFARILQSCLFFFLASSSWILPQSAMCNAERNRSYDCAIKPIGLDRSKCFPKIWPIKFERSWNGISPKMFLRANATQAVVGSHCDISSSISSNWQRRSFCKLHSSLVNLY